MAWMTEPIVERISALVKDGMSATDIAWTLAREFNVQPTRNAVIGVIHRKGLRRGAAAVPQRHSKSKSSEPTALQRFARRAAPTSTPKDDLRIPLGQRCGILGLTLSTCRWPEGDPQRDDFYYCGALVLSGEVYCVSHCRRAWARDTR